MDILKKGELRYVSIRFFSKFAVMEKIDAGLTVNISGRLLDLSTPQVMGIVNITPDSFFAGSRTESQAEIRSRIEGMYADGVDILDLGGYSSRPGAEDISPDEEYLRLARALEVVREVRPDAVVSVDTFRADVARRCVEDWDVQIINDIGGGTLDAAMFETVASLGVAYVLMHMRGTPQTMTSLTDYADVTQEVLTDLMQKVYRLRQLGVRDVILDPGFGFAKTVDQNYQLLAELQEFTRTGLPVLAGLSRKSMIWRPLGITPAESLPGTVALHLVALLKGAHIIRVHDVREGVETVKMARLLRQNGEQVL